VEISMSFGNLAVTLGDRKNEEEIAIVENSRI
jgi:hypothetical protein